MLLGDDARRKLELRHMRNDELFQLYETELVLRLRSQKNLEETKKLLQKFKEFLGEYPPSAQLARSFLSQFADRKSSTLRRYATRLRPFMEWYGEKLNLKIKTSQSLPPKVRDEEIQKLLEAVKAKTTHKKSIERDTLLIEMAALSGLRRGELANLEVQDVHLDKGILIVRQGKGQKDRIVPLAKTLKARLSKLMGDRDSKEKVFGLTPASISNKIHNFAAKAGVSLHAHSLRHAFATNLVDRGVNLRSVQALLGHDSLETTQQYLGYNDEQLRQAIDLLDAPLKPTEDLESEKQACSDSSEIRSYTALSNNDLSMQKRRVKHQKEMLLLVERWKNELDTDLGRHPIRDLGHPGAHTRLDITSKGSDLIWLVLQSGDILLSYPLEAEDKIETIIVKGYLYDHLNSGGYSSLLGQVDNWKASGGKELVERARLLAKIDKAVQKSTGLLPEMFALKIGPKHWFSDSIACALVDKVYGISSYEPIHGPDGNGLYQLRCGGAIIAITSDQDYAEYFQQLHSGMMNHPGSNITEVVKTIIELQHLRHSAARVVQK